MSFKVIRINSIIKPLSLDGLKMFTFQENNLLALWYKTSALFFTVEFHGEEIKHCFGVLKLPYGIKDIIIVKKSILCLVESGVIYIVDLDEEGLRKLEHVLEYREFKFTKDILSICTTSEGFVVLKQMGELMVFKVSYVELRKSNIFHLITKNIPCHINSDRRHKYSFITAHRSCDFHLNLASVLFRDTALLDCDILFIAVESGNVYWLPILKSPLNCDFNLIQCSTSPVMAIVCAMDEKTKKYDKIMILSSNGSVAVIWCSHLNRQLKYNTHYFPGSIKSICSVQQNKIFYSDGFNLWHSELVTPETENINFITKLLPIKGVITLFTGSDGKYVLAGSRHAILYRLESSTCMNVLGENEGCVKWSETAEKDSKSILSELQHSAHELVSLKEILAVENKALHEISIATRGGLFKEMFKLKIEVDDDIPFANKQTLRVSVLNESPQEFSKEFWSFHIFVNTGDWNINTMEKLECPFKPNSSLIFVIPVDRCKLTFPVTVDCSIVLIIPLGNLNDISNSTCQFLEIPLQRLLLDITYFLSPVLDESLVNHRQSLHTEEERWEKLLIRFRHTSPVQNHLLKSSGTHQLHCYSFKLPEIKSWTIFIDEIVRNSQHRFLHNFKNVQMIKFRVRHSIVIFTYHHENHSVDIISSNKDILNEMKDSIIHHFFSERESDNVVCICLDEIDLVKAQNLKLALELELVNGASLENLNCLKREIRKLVNT